MEDQAKTGMTEGASVERTVVSGSTNEDKIHALNGLAMDFFAVLSGSHGPDIATAKAKIEEGIKMAIKGLSVCLALLFMVACTTAFERPDGTFDVPRNVEVRSPFGTNAGFVKLEHCLKAEKNQLGFMEYTDCHLQKDWVPTQSQGQGGQIVNGALIGIGVGVGGAVSGSSNASISSSSISNATATAPMKGGHH